MPSLVCALGQPMQMPVSTSGMAVSVLIVAAAAAAAAEVAVAGEPTGECDQTNR